MRAEVKSQAFRQAPDVMYSISWDNLVFKVQKHYNRKVIFKPREGNSLKDSICLPSVWFDSSIVASAEEWNSRRQKKVYWGYMHVEIFKCEPGLGLITLRHDAAPKDPQTKKDRTIGHVYHIAAQHSNK